MLEKGEIQKSQTGLSEKSFGLQTFYHGTAVKRDLLMLIKMLLPS